jgi:hypothetical protein
MVTGHGRIDGTRGELKVFWLFSSENNMLPSTPADQQRCCAILCLLRRDQPMALAGRGERHIAQGFLATQSDGKYLTGRKTIERKTRPNKGHWTDFAADIDRQIGKDWFVHSSDTRQMFNAATCGGRTILPIWW